MVIVATGGVPDTSFLEAARIWSPASGTCWAAMSSPPAASCSTTTMAGTRGRRRRWRWPKKGVDAGGGDARPDARLRGRRHQLPQLSARALPARRQAHARPRAALGAPRGQPAGRAASGTSMPRRRSSGWSTRSWSSTAPCPRTSSTMRSRTARATAVRSMSTDWSQGAPEEIVSNPGRPLPALPGRRRRLLAQHPRRDLRRAPALQGPLTRPADDLRHPGPLRRPPASSASAWSPRCWRSPAAAPSSRRRSARSSSRAWPTRGWARRRWSCWPAATGPRRSCARSTAPRKASSTGRWRWSTPAATRRCIPAAQAAGVCGAAEGEGCAALVQPAGRSGACRT